MRIESGPTTERQVRNGLMFLMVAVFAVWFARDGWRGYASNNFRQYLNELPPEHREAAAKAPIYLTVKEATTAQAKAAVDQREPRAVRDALIALYGGPPSFETPEAWYYYGPAWTIRIPIKNGRPAGDPIPTKPAHTETDLLTQRAISVCLSVLAVYLAIHLIRVRMTRAVVDDAGLKLRGRAPIAWDEMRRLDTGRFNEKGWLDLYYERDGDEKRVRLDEYHFAKFDEIIAEVCRRKGFPDPVVAMKRANETPVDSDA